MDVRLRRSLPIALILLLCTTPVVQAQGPTPDPATRGPEPLLSEHVNPFVGTSGIPWALGMLFPGATAPFGMVRLSPDSAGPSGFHLANVGTAGYYFLEKNVLGFSHTRLSGTGATDGGAFRVIPARAPENRKPRVRRRYKRPPSLAKDTEQAVAGYYSVGLDSLGVRAELTATPHAGVHRYSFEPGEVPWILIDATSALSGSASEGLVRVLPEAGEVVGEARIGGSFAGRYGGLKGYFVARFSRPIDGLATWQDGRVVLERTEVSGNDVGAALRFGNAGEAVRVEMALAMSYVSLENARANLDAEVGPTVDFDAEHDEATARWEAALGRVQIESADPTIQRIFYTALYHSMIMPTLFTDVNGEYLGFGRTIGQADDFTYRTDLSLWDTFRTEHALLQIVAPEVQRDSVKSLIRMARIGGTLPRWAAGGGYSGSMFGSPAHFVIAEAYTKGITDFEVDEALGYMKNEALNPPPASPLPFVEPKGRDAITECLANGYCPDDAVRWSVSRTLEYAWADSAIANLARALGADGDAEFFDERAQAYRNAWNPETLHFQARDSDGTWFADFNPEANEYFDQFLALLGLPELARGYAEGSARQYRYSVPHDPAGLIDLFGGPDVFVTELRQFMEDATPNLGAIYPGSGYWHGNQHDMHTIFLFNEAGRPELTQEWTRWALQTRYADSPVGLDGNDDGGTLSAWYILAGGMGIYPISGSDRYWVTAPIVESARVDMGKGRVLRVTTTKQSADHPYIQSVSLDGERLCTPHLRHGQIANGGELHHVLGPDPAPGGGFDCP